MSVLGGILIDSEASSRAMGVVDESMFYRAANRKIFRAMARLNGQEGAIDVILVSEELKKTGDLEGAGGLPYLAELLDAVPTAANIEYHAKVVREHAERRRIQSLARRILLEVEDPEQTPADVLEIAREQLQEIQSGTLRGGHFPAPLSVGEIFAKPVPDTPWLAEGLIPAGGNLLLAGYPKSHKTHFHMELAVACATGTPFLGRYATQAGLKTGLILLEGGEREQAHRLDRIARARGIRGEDLEGLVYVWHRPPLRLTDARVMASLGEYVGDLDLDALMVDAWAYASEGNSNEDWTVTPQLMALSRLRDYRPGLTSGLTHHARKGGPDPKGERLTDIIRGSGAFGGWYDTCLALARKDEGSPHVTVRTELREYPSPKSFVFTVEDEEPASPSNLYVPQGALYLRASDLSPTTLKVRERAQEKTEAVLAYVRANPGCSKREIRADVTGNNATLDAAVELLRDEGRIRDEGGVHEGMRFFATLGEAA